MVSSTSHFTLDTSHVGDRIGCSIPAQRWTCRQEPKRNLDFWICTAYKGQRNPGCGHFKWVEDAKNLEFYLNKIEDHLMSMEKKIDEGGENSEDIWCNDCNETCQ